jgi:hypothetical protein
MKEKDLYSPIAFWIEELLRARFRKQEIIVEDTSAIELSTWLSTHNLASKIEYGEFFNFKVDITGVIINRINAKLFLVECKLKYITINDLSQILGYSRIANPYRAMIISPFGANRNLHRLVMVSGRNEVLRFDDDQSNDSVIRICKWNINRKDIDYSASIPLGFHP